MKETIKVYVRTRPTSAFATDSILIDSGRGQIDLIFKGSKKDSAVSNAQERYPFSFTGIMHNSTQENVYNTCCKSVITSAFDGYNGFQLQSFFSSILYTLFSYYYGLRTNRCRKGFFSLIVQCHLRCYSYHVLIY